MRRAQSIALAAVSGELNVTMARKALMRGAKKPAHPGRNPEFWPNRRRCRTIKRPN